MQAKQRASKAARAPGTHLQRLQQRLHARQQLQPLARLAGVCVEVSHHRCLQLRQLGLRLCVCARVCR